MQLLTGPAGSGKTFTVLEGLRAALRRKDGGIRLLVPTATMARHLRNQMAREGFIFSPAVIQTLSRFIEPWVGDLPLVSNPVLHVLVERSVHRLKHPEFAKVAHIAGFHARLAAIIEECSAAGCDAAALRAHLPAAGPGRALAGVFEDVSRALDERKLGMRATRLIVAAERIEEAGTGPVKTIWLDGFFSLTDPELSAVKAMARHADVTVTLPADQVASAARERLLAAGFEEHSLTRCRVSPGRELFVAPGIEREADEIARRILEEVAGGRLFREIGIIVRAPDVYVSLLRATLEHFGIPARFYFDSVLTEQPAVRYLAGAVDAMLGGWNHEQTLAIMKLAPGVGVSGPMDRYDFDLRKKLPGAGIEPLRQLAVAYQTDDHRVRVLLERLAELDGWRALTLRPAEWCEQFARLRALYRPQRPRDGVTHAAALEWRSQTQSLDLFEAAAAEAARSFDPKSKLPLNELWPVVKAALRLTPLRVADQRHDVVHVLSAYEARQWELPVVFVCGLVEGQFPRYRPPDPFLPEHARRRLKESGLRIRSAEDTEREERLLFDSALSRATASLVLSYPRSDARGELNLPSLFLHAGEDTVKSRPVRLQLDEAPAPAPSGIRSADLLRVIGQKHGVVRPTSLESYLQCPFQFFGRHTLKLEGSPPRPEKRLDFRTCGNIVHSVLAAWVTTHDAIDEIFERVFRTVAQAESIPESYETELWRAKMQTDLRRFTLSDSWPAGSQSQTEPTCEFKLDDSLTIRCRIDRLIQTTDGRAFVIDYKYSKKKGREYAGNENLLQGPYYWLAAERAFQLRAAGMYYCCLRDGVEYAGWGETHEWMGRARIQPFTPEWLEAAVATGVRAAGEIASGRTAPAPSDLSKCRLCDFKDVCRYEGVALAIAGGAE